MTTVQPLKKVKLSLLAGSDAETFNLTSSPVDFEFIYGATSDGLCPFENDLAGKKEGERLNMAVSTAEAQNYFGNFYHKLYHVLGLQIMPAKLFWQMEISAVTTPDNREVVQALAKSLGGCGGGSCDCGCS